MDPLDPFADLLAGPAFSEYLSEADLRRICGRDDLENVTLFETQLDAVSHDVQRLGERLPQLQELKLNGSVVHSLRDLGTRLRGVTVLWLGRTGLEQLSGTVALPCLEELYISYNKVADLSPLAGMASLRVLDAEGNKVADIESVQFLQQCPALAALTLEQNPIAQRGSYRSAVREALPSLEYLDDLPLAEEEDAADAVGNDLLSAAVDESVMAEITARLDEEVRASVAGQGLDADPQAHSERVQALLEEERANVPLTTDLFMDEKEKLKSELKAVVTAVKNAQFRDPCLLSDSEGEGDEASDEDRFNTFSDEEELREDDEFEQRMLDSLDPSLATQSPTTASDDGSPIALPQKLTRRKGTKAGAIAVLLDSSMHTRLEDEEMLTPRAADAVDEADDRLRPEVEYPADDDRDAPSDDDLDLAAPAARGAAVAVTTTPPRPPAAAQDGRRRSSGRLQAHAAKQPLGSLLDRLDGGKAAAPRTVPIKKKPRAGVRSAADFKAALQATQQFMQQAAAAPTAAPTSPDVASPESHLTYGAATVFCGNATRSLLSHRQSDPVPP